tara:strand:- start:850 stop:1740 length:891 start_codon:yes stop_codon:yes gene_type:complete
MKKNKVLIAGGGGNIGRPLYDSLCKKENITMLVNNSKPLSGDYINLNLLDFEKIINFVKNNKKFDVLIFLVGLAHKKGKKSDFEEFNSLNFITLKNLTDIFIKYDKVPSKIIFTSTISVYGERLNIDSYTEDVLPRPKTPYAITKFKAEEYLRNKFDSSYWILRLAPVYSSSFKLNINRRTKIIGRNFLVGDGNVKLSLCHQNNIISIIESIIAGEIDSGTYNLSDEKIYTYIDLHEYQKNDYFFKIPKFIVKFYLFIGKIIKNNFLIENSIKLISDNIYPSEKIARQKILIHKIK